MINLMSGGVIAFLFGLVYGSFLNVVILRFDNWMSIVKGRSACPHCQQKLSWLDLLPILSYLMLRGRCRYCQKPISWQYPVVEIVTSALIVAGYYLIFYFNSFELWQGVAVMAAYVFVVGALMTLFFHDLYEMMIPDVLANALLIGSAVFSLLYYDSWLNTLYGGLVGLVPITLLVVIGKGQWMGEGDIKIAAALGLLVAWPNALVFICLSFLVGGLLGAILIASRMAKLRTAVPFVPFLIFGALVALFWGPLIVEWYWGFMGYGFYL